MLTVLDPSPRVRVTVSEESDVAGRMTSKERLAWFAPVMNALPAPAPFVRATEVGASGAMTDMALATLSPPVQLYRSGIAAYSHRPVGSDGSEQLSGSEAPDRTPVHEPPAGIAAPGALSA